MLVSSRRRKSSKPMSVGLSWQIEGSKQLSRVLQGIGEGIKDWTPAFKETADELAKVFANDVFTTQGAAIGESWKPLQPKYLAKKLADGYPADTLVRTGAMQGAFKTMFKADFAEVWNAIEYFKYHQSKAPRKKLPRRVMMKLGENQKQLVVKIFHTYWWKKVNGKLS
jgi:phage gpG-like protein